MAGRLPVLHREAGVEQQHAVRRPVHQRPGFAGCGRRGAAAQFLEDVAQRRRCFTPGATENARPSACPGPWYGSWPRMTRARSGQRRQLQGAQRMGRIDHGASREALAQEARAPAGGRRRNRPPPAASRAPAARLQGPGEQPRRLPARTAAAAAPPGSGAEQRGQRLARIGARMKASPTRKACTPAARMRCTSAGARMPDSVTSRRSAGTSAACQRGVQRDLEGAQVAVVDAHQRRLQLQRALQFGRVVHLDQHRHVEAARDGSSSAICASSRQAAISRIAVGAHRARLVDLVRVDHEVLAQHRQVAGGARLLQVVGWPWKNCRSVSTDRQAAPCSA
jgi:hypothetical protein